MDLGNEAAAAKDEKSFRHTAVDGWATDGWRDWKCIPRPIPFPRYEKASFIWDDVRCIRRNENKDKGTVKISARNHDSALVFLLSGNLQNIYICRKNACLV